ncbi:site-specific tyrosine recombinase XerC [Anaerohalosphaera lusitana]|uniref:Site-specific tyrosine recombinase XerC n=1 Tax=Anaerohalosphaera lusitana TaxID=1936003 RepID=A0A1U9NJE4_9BACT|nr:site-specific integrase [Anaerohalosphaera lusitana]AQT68052.1 site-specific tyrosine recombinase XerC [Anaerohalosphaera lusitana]
MAKAKKNHNLPGAIYKNGNRWWWKVQLPGEDKLRSRPLKPFGSSLATKDHCVAVECAKVLMAKAVFESQQDPEERIENIAELCKAYMAHAREYYKKADGSPGKEVKQIEYSIKPLVNRFGNLSIDEFGPLKLVEVREQMIGRGWCRNLINQRVGRLKRMFKWAVSREIASSVLYNSLATVEGLRKGRTAAKESRPIKPVSEDHVHKSLPYMTKVVANMVELQLLTGMRPGELVIMRPCDIEKSEDIWHYCPERHKNDYRGFKRIISIGPRGQEILRPYLLRSPEAYCFSPAESERQRLSKLHQERKTPPGYGNRPGSNRRPEPKRKPGECFTSGTYGNSVRKAVKAARRDVEKRGGDPDKELPKWTPYQLRHTAATKARKLFNYETAGALLGHSNMSATQIYAERNQGLADMAAQKFG